MSNWGTTRSRSGRRRRWLLWWGSTITSNCPSSRNYLFLAEPLNTLYYLIRAKYLNLSWTGTKWAGSWCSGKTCWINISYNKINDSSFFKINRYFFQGIIKVIFWTIFLGNNSFFNILIFSIITLTPYLRLLLFLWFQLLIALVPYDSLAIKDLAWALVLVGLTRLLKK